MSSRVTTREASVKLCHDSSFSLDCDVLGAAIHFATSFVVVPMCTHDSASWNDSDATGRTPAHAYAHSFRRSFVYACSILMNVASQLGLFDPFSLQTLLHVNPTPCRFTWGTKCSTSPTSSTLTKSSDWSRQELMSLGST